MDILRFSNAGGFKTKTRYPDMLAGNPAYAGGPISGYDALASVTLNGSQSSITFAGIPSTYTHLQIRTMHLMTSNAAANILALGYGGTADTTSGDYYSHHLTGNGASATSGAYADKPQFYWVTGNGSSSIPEVEIIDILDYGNTNKYKTIRALSGVDNNGSGEVNLTSGLWMKTNAVDTIQFTCNTGNFAQYSTFALYGVR